MDVSFDDLIDDNSFERKIISACLPSAFYGGKVGGGRVAGAALVIKLQ